MGQPVRADVLQVRATRTEPGVKGDTASAVLKPAPMESGLAVQVPLFVGPGEVIKISTRTGDYIERVSTSD